MCVRAKYMAMDPHSNKQNICLLQDYLSHWDYLLRNADNVCLPN